MGLVRRRYALGKLSGKASLDHNLKALGIELRGEDKNLVLQRIIELGDHHIVVGEVVGANVAKAPEGRADEAILEMKELGEKVFYGG